MLLPPRSYNHGEQMSCPYCDAVGNTGCEACDSNGQLPNGEVCPQCKGSGDVSCDYCTGEGFI